MEITFSVCQQCHSVNKVQAEKALNGEAVCGKCQASLPMHGLVTEVDSDGFRKILRNSDKPVVVDFWASWCGPCKMYGPQFELASTKNKNAVFLKVSTESEQQLSSELGIRGIPCTIVFKNGQEVKRQPGAMSAQDVGNLVSSL